MGTFGVKRASDEPFCPSTVDGSDTGHYSTTHFPNMSSMLLWEHTGIFGHAGNTEIGVVTYGRIRA